MAVATAGLTAPGAPSACRPISYRPETGTSHANHATFGWEGAHGADQSLTVSLMVKSPLLTDILELIIKERINNYEN